MFKGSNSSKWGFFSHLKLIFATSTSFCLSNHTENVVNLLGNIVIYKVGQIRQNEAFFECWKLIFATLTAFWLQHYSENVACLVGNLIIYKLLFFSGKTKYGFNFTNDTERKSEGRSLIHSDHSDVSTVSDFEQKAVVKLPNSKCPFRVNKDCDSKS